MLILETDVRMTKDGVLLTCHDENFHRLCGIDQLCLDTVYDDLPTFQDNMPLHFSKSQHF